MGKTNFTKTILIGFSSLLCGCGLFSNSLPTSTEFMLVEKQPLKDAASEIRSLIFVPPSVLTGEKEDYKWAGTDIADKLSANQRYRIVTPNEFLVAVQKMGNVDALKKTTSMTQAEKDNFIRRIAKDQNAEAIVFVEDAYDASLNIIFPVTSYRDIIVKIISSNSGKLLWQQHAVARVTNDITAYSPEVLQTMVQKLVDNFNQTAK